MKPRITLKKRFPVFSARIWVCQGYDARCENWHIATGWTPKEAYFNWKSYSTIRF